MRIALLSYRSKPHCGGQGVYVRHLCRELARLGHQVEVISGQPYPVLDEGVALTELPSLDLYRQPDPFRTPSRGEYRDWIDVLEVATMWTAGFPEPLTFSLRAAGILSDGAATSTSSTTTRRSATGPARRRRRPARHDDPPPDHRRPQAGPGAADRLRRKLGRAPLVRLHPHAEARRPPAAAPS